MKGEEEKRKKWRQREKRGMGGEGDVSCSLVWNQKVNSQKGRNGSKDE